ncbi:hypothetical protein K502DRAFT_331908 [Neoconidiobolus thromboides FSU 785]|nr:hypothetical protein K502DRAFT_331908 [Neoconidiobolus thromboides FSU 785]
MDSLIVEDMREIGTLQINEFQQKEGRLIEFKIYKSHFKYCLIMDYTQYLPLQNITKKEKESLLNELIIKIYSETFTKAVAVEQNLKQNLILFSFKTVDDLYDQYIPILSHFQQIKCTIAYQLSEYVYFIKNFNLPGTINGFDLEDIFIKHYSEYGHVSFCKHHLFNQSTLYSNFVTVVLIANNKLNEDKLKLEPFYIDDILIKMEFMELNLVLN